LKIAKKKVLVTGGGGLLGQHLNLAASIEYDLLTLYRSNPGNCHDFQSSQVDVSDFDSLTACIRQFKPDYIIHCAAVSNPNKADAQTPAEVNKVNVLASALLAQEAARIGAKLIYTSTDLVYAGYRGSNLNEDAKLAPMSLYAETKLMGEVKIRQYCENAVIARTPLLFGFGYTGTTNNFQEMVRKFNLGQSVNLFFDQFRSPLSVREAARILVALLEKATPGTTVNMGGPRRVSRVEMGELACAAGGFNKGLINAVSMDSVPSVVPIADVSLDISRLRSFGIEPEPLEKMIETEVRAIKAAC
jgi:dTDP-4-dehydrorhamnose reductase